MLVVGLLSAVLGALYAQMEKDIKRILAYSSVENMGIIFGAFGCGMVLMTTPRHDYALIGFFGRCCTFLEPLGDEITVVYVGRGCNACYR